MSLIPFRKKPAPKTTFMDRAMAFVPMKPVDENEREDAIVSLERLNAQLADSRASISREQDRERRLVLAIAARKAQLDVLEFEAFAAVGREVERAVKLDAAEPTTLESKMTIVEPRVAAE